MVAPPAAPSRPLPSLGRFELRKLLGKSARSMAWLAFDPHADAERMLVLPRAQPPDAPALQRWTDAVRLAARLDHPHLAPPVEIGAHEHWPYVAYDRALGLTLAERLSPQGEPAADVARWAAQALDGLAFAHDAGVAHRDLQLHLLVLGEHDTVRVIGLEVAADDGASRDGGAAGGARTLSIDPGRLRDQRDAAERDVLALGLVMHHLLAGAPALDEPDVSRVIERLPPQGRDIVRLPWGIARPVPEPLRAIVNRASDRQARQRYRSARTLARALDGWLEADAQGAGGAFAQLLERVRRLGALPAMPGGGRRAAQLARMERERTNELAELVLRDLALAFELLRIVNTAQLRGSQLAASGPVLTVRRAIAMVGLDGVRQAAQGLRPWPGPLAAPAADALSTLIDRAKRAGRVAQALRPAGYDAEVVYLVTLLQNLGRLVVQYHFPDEAAQIRRLMQPAPPAGADHGDEPGMSEEAASFAVLGADLVAIGGAVARQWGLDEAVLHMTRRLPTSTPVRAVEKDKDDDLLRALASAANEAVDAVGLDPKQVVPALQRVAQRYARVLGLTLRDLQAALQGLPVAADGPRSDDAAAFDASTLTGSTT